MSKYAFRSDPQKRKERLEALYLASKQSMQGRLDQERPRSLEHPAPKTVQTEQPSS